MSHSGEVLDVAGGREPDLAIDLQPLFSKLRPGPGLPPERVFADQHRRLQGALIVLVDQGGWESVRVRSLVRTAGVSTTTFYKHFADVDACLVSTFDTAVGAAVRAAVKAGRRSSDWSASLRASVGSLMRTWAAEPRAARLVLVDIFAAGARPRKRIGHMLGELETLLAVSFEKEPAVSRPPRPLLAAMTAGMLHVTRTTLLNGRAAELPGLADELVRWMSALPGSGVLLLLAAAEGPATAQPRREPAPFPAGPSPRLEGVGDRERLLRAALKLVATEGLSAVTPPKLRAEAEVSRRRFDSMFESVDECFLDSIETIAGDAATGAQEWSTAATGWSHQTCQFTLAVCAQAARNRAQARLAFLGIFAAGRAGLLLRQQMVSHMATSLQATVPPPQRPSAVAAEASIAASWQFAQSNIAAGRARRLPRLSPLLAYIVLAPITGPTEASNLVQAEFG